MFYVHIFDSTQEPVIYDTNFGEKTMVCDLFYSLFMSALPLDTRLSIGICRINFLHSMI